LAQPFWRILNDVWCEQGIRGRHGKLEERRLAVSLRQRCAITLGEIIALRGAAKLGVHRGARLKAPDVCCRELRANAFQCLTRIRADVEHDTRRVAVKNSANVQQNVVPHAAPANDRKVDRSQSTIDKLLTANDKPSHSARDPV
jgi:hypothetical protein